MARRAIIRSRNLGTDVAQCEELIKRDFKEIWKEHIETLEDIAVEVADEAYELVPVDKGFLRDSINVRVSKSRRYPGIIAHASAKNKGKNKGFDYALAQEENEEYSHDIDKMAHYLGGPFAREISYWYEDITGEILELPDDLQHAVDYIEERGK